MNDSIALICIKLHVLVDICVNSVDVFLGTAGHGAEAEEWWTGRGRGLPCVGEEAGDIYWPTELGKSWDNSMEYRCGFNQDFFHNDLFDNRVFPPLCICLYRLFIPPANKWILWGSMSICLSTMCMDIYDRFYTLYSLLFRWNVYWKFRRTYWRSFVRALWLSARRRSWWSLRRTVMLMRKVGCVHRQARHLLQGLTWVACIGGYLSVFWISEWTEAIGYCKSGYICGMKVWRFSDLKKLTSGHFDDFTFC